MQFIKSILKKIFWLGIFFLACVGIFWVVLFILENFIVIAQEIDYYFYTSSNISVQQLALLEKESRHEYIAVGPTPLVRIEKSVVPSKPKVTVVTKITKTSQKKKELVSISKHKDYWIVIPKIGVDTHILRYGSLSKRMYKGVAIVKDFGRPDKKGLPTILVSHRFGYVWWTPKYRRINSFYNIDKLKPGDKIFIYWKSKLYKYKIKKTQVSTLISNYKHDLILYSCIAYFNPKRIIIYADKIE